MPKANRICHCCGKGYYYCPSCPDDRRDPRVYVMWDSELCREIFNVLTNESIGKISTLECKERLIKLGVNKDTILKDNVRKHVDRVMTYEEEKPVEVVELSEEINVTEKVTESEAEIQVENIVEDENENTKKISKTRTRKSSVKNEEE